MAKGKYQEWISPDGLLTIEGWARHGLTNEQIAKNIGVSSKTFYQWLNKYGEIGNSLKKGRRPLDVELENTLIMKALGFTDPNGMYHPPDNASLIFLLKNRQRDYYRDRPRDTLEDEKLKLENEKLRLQNETIRRVLSSEEYEDDGLLDALKKAAEVWRDE